MSLLVPISTRPPATTGDPYVLEPEVRLPLDVLPCFRVLNVAGSDFSGETMLASTAAPIGGESPLSAWRTIAVVASKVAADSPKCIVWLWTLESPRKSLP